MDALRKLVAPGECVARQMDRATAMPIPSGQASGALYEESVLAPSGMIYFPPCDARRVLKLDPTSGAMSYVGPDFGGGIAKYRGAVLGMNGIVYGIPYSAASILRIDPSADSVATFGSLGSGEKWIGGVLAPNGVIYGFPASAAQVLRINTADESLRLFGSISGIHKYVGGALSPTGLIFGIPWQESRLLVIDPETDGISFIASGAAGGGLWAFGALGLDGLVYGLPGTSASILVVDPITRSVSTIPAAALQMGGAVGPNGLIYLAPGVNALNTTSRGISQRIAGTVSGYRCAVLAPNGAVHFSPHAVLPVLRVDFPYLPPMSLPMDAVLSPFLNWRESTQEA
jgi:hypothetical protein